MHLWVQNYQFYPKFVHFSEIVLQKLHFRVKSVKSIYFFVFSGCTFVGTKLRFLSKICTFWSNFLVKTSILE